MPTPIDPTLPEGAVPSDTAAVLEALSDPIILVDHRGVTIWANTAFCLLCGVKAALGRVTPAWVASGHEQRWREAIAAQIHNPSPVAATVDIELLRDGHRIPVTIHWTPAAACGGDVVAALGVVHERSSDPGVWLPRTDLDELGLLLRRLADIAGVPTTLA